MERKKREPAYKERLTPGRIDDFTCPPGKQQAFLWDTDTPNLAVRATATAKSFVFERKLNGRTIRISLGNVKSRVLNSVWSTEGNSKREVEQGVREQARTLIQLIDAGKDPRQVAADEIAAENAKREQEAAAEQARQKEALRNSVTVEKAWAQYLANPPMKKGKTWGERHLADHHKVMQQERTKENGKTLTAGALASLAGLPLSELTKERVTEWILAETPKRPTQTALAFRLLRAFLNWCESKPEFKGLAASDACDSSLSKQYLPEVATKQDCLQREQLRLWFDAVKGIPNPTIAAYLQGLLITGARRNELASLQWEDVDFQWNSLTIRDKVEGERTIPLTPYLASILKDLKRRNDTPPTVRRLKALKENGNDWTPSPWVFSSQTSATGRLEEPSIAHRKAIAAAGLPPVSLHGLRRSFNTLSEWVEVPAGVVSQIMGHKPSATAEKHYKVRPLDLLRMWHTRIEAWILEQAGIEHEEAKQVPELVKEPAAR